MDQLINALTGLMLSQGSNPPGDDVREITVDLSGAPASVQALAKAMTQCAYDIDLGTYYLCASSDPLRTLEPEISMAAEGGLDDTEAVLASTGPGGKAFLVNQTLLLEPDDGGMSALGVYWANGRACLAIVEMENPTEDSLITLCETPESFFAALDKINRGKSTKELKALRAATQLAVPEQEVASVGGIQTWKGAKPAHPWARALEHFGKDARVRQSEASASGKVAVAKKFKPGNPYEGSAVEVLSADGSSRAVEWTDTIDIFGMCVVPGHERVLICTGMPGPVLELDLESLATREIHPSAKWSCGFVTPDHLALLVGDEVHVFLYGSGPLGEPVAKATAAGMNIAVAHGRVLSRTKDYSTTKFQMLQWNGSALVEAGEHPLAEKVSSFEGSAVVDGQALLCAVGMKDLVHWYRVT